MFNWAMFRISYKSNDIVATWAQKFWLSSKGLVISKRSCLNTKLNTQFLKFLCFVISDYIFAYKNNLSKLNFQLIKTF